MKSMLIAAASVGAVIAGLILILRKTDSGTKLLSRSEGTPASKQISRAQHAMG